MQKGESNIILYLGLFMVIAIIIIVILNLTETNFLKNSKRSDFKCEIFPASGSSNNLFVSTGDYFPPMFNMRGSKPVGFDIDLIEEVAKELGKTGVKYIIGEGAQNPVMSNKADLGIGAITITDERKRYVDFSIPYFKTKHTVLTRNYVRINSRNDLVNKICVVRNNSLAEQIAVQNNFRIIRVNSNAEVLNLIRNLNADFTINDNIYLSEIVRYHSEFKVVDIPFKTNPFSEGYYDNCGIVVKKNNIKLLAEVNNALRKIKRDGRMDQIEKKWFK